MDKPLDNLNEEQKTAVLHTGGPLLIIAGAGTGKTTVMVRRIARLVVEEKFKPEEIVALTYTEKAAQELEERIDRLLPYGALGVWVSTFHGFCNRILDESGVAAGYQGKCNIFDEND